MVRLPPLATAIEGECYTSPGSPVVLKHSQPTPTDRYWQSCLRRPELKLPQALPTLATIRLDCPTQDQPTSHHTLEVRDGQCHHVGRILTVTQDWV